MLAHRRLAYNNILDFILETELKQSLSGQACVVGAEGAKTRTSRLPGPVGARVAPKAPPSWRSERNKDNAALALAHVEPL